MRARLGDVLVGQGVISAGQRDEILRAQEATGRPFGDLAERIFGVSSGAIEAAWASQYAGEAERIDPREEAFDRGALALVSRRQAWQFRVLPIRLDGSEVRICTTREHLVRALRFCTWHIGHRAYFVIAEDRALGEALVRHYPMPGLGPEAVTRGWSRAS